MPRVPRPAQRCPPPPLGVALVLDAPVACEVQGLRRALGDGSLQRIAPHLTLVPPVNVRAGGLDEALAVLRTAASAREARSSSTSDRRAPSCR